VILGLTILGALFAGWTFRALTAGGAERASARPIYSGVSTMADAPSAKPSTPTPIVVRVVTGDARTSGNPDAASTEDQLKHTITLARQDAASVSPSGDVSLASPGSTEALVSLLIDVGKGLASQPSSPPSVVNGLSVVANGTDIVIANDGSIVSVGDNTVVHGNTGDASSSATIGVDVADSTLTSGSSDLSSTTDPSLTNTPPTGSTPTTSQPSNGESAVLTNAESACAAPASRRAGSDTRSIALSGWTNQSIHVQGTTNLVSYGDSNVFYKRRGNLNANTGETRTSGLNVVDSTGSAIGSGNSSIVADTSNPQTLINAACVPSGTSGSSATVSGSGGIATATADDVLVIGGDGVQDRGVTVDGSRNVVTDDDGNVAVGGTGDMNAQTGASESSGAAVMGIVDSQIQSGDSSQGPPRPAPA
jgi:hypothetical protein